ncbi:DUF1616 domain-containing protein [Halohasta salina]|uniref:DUF1616 domain-containing protein n=1 Tax=Halohasta salina TaxID=2961621 RepID=UPI0020A34249|nr:DUF1616 domain-containing protein [Halohasta salina]
MDARPSDRRPGRYHWSTDLAVAVVIVIALNLAVFAPGLRETPLRIPLGLAVAFVVPGYALLAALYPERSRTDEPTENVSTDDDTPLSAITPTERYLLAIATSIVLVPLVGFVLDRTSVGVRLAPFVLSVSAVTVALIGLAAIRRRRRPADVRFRLQPPGWLTELRSKWLAYDGYQSLTLTVLLVLSVVCFAASVGYAATDPSAADGYSELMLVDDGERIVGDGAAERLASSTSPTVGVSVSNHEGRDLTYTVVVVAEEVSGDSSDRTVDERTEIDRFEMAVDDGETRVREYAFTPTADDRNRIVWFLYTGDPPAEPSPETASYDVHLWTTSPPGGSTPR